MKQMLSKRSRTLRVRFFCKILCFGLKTPAGRGLDVYC
jgi:uncharacterized protein YjbK